MDRTVCQPVTIGSSTFGAERLFLFAGPCVLENLDLTLEIAGRVREVAAACDVPVVFKASFDKANRSSLASERGPGLERGLEWLAAVKSELGLPVVTDVHSPEQCTAVAEVVDVLQIPAFLCRQTDLLVAAARTGKAVNIKKGQFLAPWDMGNAVRKCQDSGNANVLVTERGTSFGYGRLVVDMSGLWDLAAAGQPVVFDATHSVQEPGALGKTTGGDRARVPLLARAAVATGAVDGLFFEVHPDPDSSPSDGPNILQLDTLAPLLDQLLEIRDCVRR
jgi:2-dehydro-3-deoxyphosphooctonate aldolase (KDO 8-P synthase)